MTDVADVVEFTEEVVPIVVVEETFAIESGVPIPPRKRGGARTSKYKFADMNVSDSIAAKTEKSAKGLISASRHYAKTHAIKFETRKEGAGIRLWRTE